METSLTTDEHIKLSEIIQEVEDDLDDASSGSVTSYSDKKIELVFIHDDNDIEDHFVTVDRKSMSIEQ